MTKRIAWGAFPSAATASSKRTFAPGSWEDHLVFGYMFRVITALAAVMVPGLALVIWGLVTGWEVRSAMAWVFGSLIAVMVLIGEGLRVGVYESRLPSMFKSSHVSDYDAAAIAVLLERNGRAKLSYRIGKRVFDIVIGLSSVIVLSPLFILVPLLIWFDSGSPAFFRQPRLGRGGLIFNIYKFRTMSAAPLTPADAVDGAVLDNRITRVGRFLRMTSIDELPQIINILGGSMTLVGPRPQTLSSMNFAKSESDLARLLFTAVKPGLTGLQFMHGNPTQSLAHYLEHRSLFQDLRILARTISYAFGKTRT